MSVLDKMLSWLWVLLVLVIPFILAFLLRVARYVVKRVYLLLYLRRIGARSLRPLAWLIPWRTACDYLIALRDPQTGQVAKTLAIQLIPTVLGGTEYCIGHVERWYRKRNFLVPMARGIFTLDFGYRLLRPRRPERIFHRVPIGAVRVYLFHPHPFALTLALRSHGRYGGVDTLTVPRWQEDILFLDLEGLRQLVAGDEGAWRWLLITDPNSIF